MPEDDRIILTLYSGQQVQITRMGLVIFDGKDGVPYQTSIGAMETWVKSFYERPKEDAADLQAKTAALVADEPNVVPLRGGCPNA